MARRAHITRQRALADRSAAQFAAPPGPAPRLAIPDLLARAVALVEAHPAADFWAGGLHTVVGNFHLCRLFRPGRPPARNVDSLVLYDPDVVTPAFTVATRVDDRYAPMTEVAGFNAWLNLQGGLR